MDRDVGASSNKILVYLLTVLSQQSKNPSEMHSSCELQAEQFPNSFSSVYSLFSNDIYSWSMWDAVRGNEQVVMQLMCEGLVCILMGHCWPAIWYVPSLDETQGVQSSWRISGKRCFGLFTADLHLAKCFFFPPMKFNRYSHLKT